MRADGRATREALAPASPVHRFEPLDPAARELVATVWTHVVPPDVSALRVVPDAAIDLVFAERGLRVAGPDTTAVLESIPAGTRVLGFQLRPGAAESLLGAPATAVRDERVDIGELWGSAGAYVVKRMGDAPDARRAAAVLEAEVGRRWQRGARPDRLAGALAERIRVSMAAPTMSALADDLGLSERQLHRRCTAAFGYGPKVLARVVRLQSVLSLLRRDPGRSLAGVAAESGFADQAHLTREVGALTGLTPVTVRSQLSPATDLDTTAAA
jgi:AraC-like DNA-binding protein